MVSILVWLAACDIPQRPPPSDDPATATLSVAPPASEHLLIDGAPASQAFTATLTYEDGTTRDVTAETAFVIDGSFGAFSGNQLSIVGVGHADVFATWREHTADADVIARLSRVRVDPSLPANTPELFAGQESSVFAPTMLYPNDGVSMPRNLGDFEIHWSGSGLNVFEASLSTEYSDVRLYVPGGNGLAAAGANASWTKFSVAEWESAVAGASTVRFQVRGISPSSPGMVHAAAPRVVHLSNEPMDGGIYYWASTATAGGSSGIFRHDMNEPGVPAEEFLTTNQTGGRCIGCHSLSRDGSRMAVTYDGGNGAATVVDVATKVAQPVTNAWNFATLTPDGTQVFTIQGYTLTVRDAVTQTVLATMTETPVTHPEISPDGTQLAYVRPATLNWDWMFGGGQIFTRSYDPVTHVFGPEQPLVTTGANNYYPSWSPDGKWIVFNRSDDTTGNGAYDNPSATVWVVKADASSPPIQLSAANLGLGLTNSWARFAPFEQTSGSNLERMFWVTVSSKRDFGTRRINAGLAESQKVPQLWMMAFFPDRVGAVPDPGALAFRLPFQSLDTRNHAAQWTEKVIVLE
jgi:hypothetical protein